LGLSLLLALPGLGQGRRSIDRRFAFGFSLGDRHFRFVLDLVNRVRGSLRPGLGLLGRFLRPS